MVPQEQRWQALVEEILRRNPQAFHRFQSSPGGPPEWFVVVEAAVHPDLFDTLRALQWERVANAASRADRTLPRLLEGDRFSVGGYNFIVKGLGPSWLSVGLLDEEGSPVTGSDVSDDLDFAPPAESPPTLPTDARSRMNLALSLIAAHSKSAR